MKFRPLQDRVLVRRIEEEEKTKGGIIIPDTAKEKPMEGEVLAAGPGTRGDASRGNRHPFARRRLKPREPSSMLLALAVRECQPRGRERAGYGGIP